MTGNKVRNWPDLSPGSSCSELFGAESIDQRADAAPSQIRSVFGEISEGLNSSVDSTDRRKLMPSFHLDDLMGNGPSKTLLRLKYK
jgi:hypothetical protein